MTKYTLEDDFDLNISNIPTSEEIEKEFFTSGDTTYNLVPGIHVYVFILTGERTVLSYVTTPFHNGIGQALQER